MSDIWDIYTKKEIIYVGPYSKIYKIEDKKTKNLFVVREINKERYEFYHKVKFNQKDITKKYDSEMIIQSYDNKDIFYIVMKFYIMNLEDYLRSREECLSIKEVHEILYHLNKIFKKIKNENQIIKDLKLSNILISWNKINQINVKLSNFGSKDYDSNTKTNLKEKKIFTLAPEILKNNDLNPKTDIWNLGIIINYLLTKKYLYDGKTETDIYKNIKLGKKLDKINDQELNDLLNKMLIEDYNKRISWEDYFNHSFFKKDYNDFPSFNCLCRQHSKQNCYYCKTCKENICQYCLSFHNYHNLIPFNKIGLTEQEIKQIQIFSKKIRINLSNFNRIKEDIESLLNKIKSINQNNNIYENDSSNNYKIYLINCLQKLNQNIQIQEKIYLNIPVNYKSNSFHNNLTLTYNKDGINHFLQLIDGRLASCSDDNTLNIYKRNTFELQLSIQEHSDWISSFIQLNDGKIITSSGDTTIKIINLIGEDKYQIEQTLEGHNFDIEKVLEIKEKELISISWDGTMKIWKLNNKNKYQCFKTIAFQNRGEWAFCNVHKLNENEFLTSSSKDQNIKFWNCNNYLHITTINNVLTTFGINRICLLEPDLFCIGGYESKGFYLIKISTHQIIKNIIGTKSINSIVKCLDGLFLCAINDEKENNSLVKYKYENQNFIKMIEYEKAHAEWIRTCIELNDGTIVSGGYDRLIKFWI